MKTMRKSTLALAVVAACCAVGTATAADSLMTVAHPTYTRQGDAIMGALPQSQLIHFSMSVTMRDRAGLDAFIAGMKNHPGQVMSTAQFMAKHAPTQAQVAKVTSWLQAQGFGNIEVAPNHLLVNATGTAAQINRAFNTTMAQFRTHDGRIAFGNTTEARIPAALQGNVLGVVGLQNVNVGHTFFKVQQPKAGAHTMAVTGHNPVEFPAIYGASSVATGAGVTVGIFTQGKITQSITDLNSFTAAHGYPTVTTQTVNTNGTGTSTSGIDEWDLDSQDIVGMAGGQVGKIIWYNTPSLSDADMNANFNTIVSANAAKIINVSIGGCETSAKGATANASDQAFAQGVAQGQTFSISTGDSGADECGNGGTTPSWPANSQYVVAAAGTTLNASTTTWSSETVWKDSGGSQSKYEPKPSWQTLWNGTYRGVADVAFDGDPNSGAQVIVKGASQQIGGTSLSAPLFAGEWTRVIATKGTGVGFAGPIIYQLPASAFHDITSGSNGISASAGYDLASGRGSMILSTALANWPGGGGGGGGNNPPTANFSFTTSGLTASFTDSSSDSDGTIASHSWTFGDGGTSTAASPSHTYAAAGTYSVTETVTDNGGATASKTSSVTVASSGGGGGGSSQLLANTSFESTGSWTGSSGVICATGCSGESAHTGVGFAWLDGYGSTHTDTLSQAVTIPSTATTATIQYYLHVDTAETTTSSAYDKLYVRLYNGSTLVKTLATYSNLNHNSGYTVHSNSINVSAYHGKKLTLKFTGTEDSSLQTSFVLDDVTLTVQ